MLRKKLRLTCEFFAALNLTTDLRNAAKAGQDWNFLPPETVAASGVIIQTERSCANNPGSCARPAGGPIFASSVERGKKGFIFGGANHVAAQQQRRDLP